MIAKILKYLKLYKEELECLVIYIIAILNVYPSHYTS